MAFAPLKLSRSAAAAELLQRLLSGHSSRSLEPPIVDSLRTAQFRAAASHSLALLIANFVNAAVVVVMAADGPHRRAAFVWAAVLSAYVTRAARLRWAKHKRPRVNQVSKRAIRRLVQNAAGLALIWGAMPVLFLESGRGEQFIVFLVSFCVISGGAFGLATVPAAAVAFVLPITGGILYAIYFGAKEPIHFLAGPLLVSYAGLLLFAAISHARNFSNSVIAQARAELAARHDPLTGLPNRAAFNAAITDAYMRLQRYGERFALLCIDLDEFKAVNDRLGHQAGDELLREAANRLTDALDERGVIARLGGDEFAVIVRALADPHAAVALAADIASRFDAAFTLDAGVAQCRASIGVALAPADGADAKSLFAAADTELYRAKRDLKKPASAIHSTEDGRVRRRRELTRDMKAGLTRGDFSLQYQPIQTLRTGRVDSFEALARWRHPRLGLIPPLEFIDIAEKNGLIHELGEWFLNEACREAAGWPGSAQVAVNVSGEQLCDASFETIFDRALKASGLPAERVQVEVTESASLAAIDEAARALRRLRERGSEIVLDDFGAGFSSFALISRLPIHRLKIDGAFVADLPFGRESLAIVDSVLGIARALNFSVTAEGVETQAQRTFLERVGCTAAQGYLIARPLDAAAARALLASGQPTRNLSAA